VPTVTKIAVLVHPPVRSTGPILEELQGVAQVLGIQRQILAVYDPGGLEPAFDTAVRGGGWGTPRPASLLFALHQNQLAALAVSHRLPAIYYNVSL